MNKIDPTSPEYSQTRQRQYEWQTGCIKNDEERLVQMGIPQKYWIYVLVNSNPAGLQPHERIGSWGFDRKWVVKILEELNAPPYSAYVDPVNRAMYFAVVDGRNLELIKSMITQSWTHEEQWYTEWLSSKSESEESS